MDQSQALQREAIALWRQYGFFLPSTVRAFLLRLADFLNWSDLTKAMK